jgi:hypothetical protein
MDWMYIVILVLAVGGGQRTGVVVPDRTYDNRADCKDYAKAVQKENRSIVNAECILIPKRIGERK